MVWWSGGRMTTLDQEKVIIALIGGNSENSQIITRKKINSNSYQHDCRCDSELQNYITEYFSVCKDMERPIKTRSTVSF